jgi:hypothetical protein
VTITDQREHPPIKKRAVFATSDGNSETVVTHLMTLHSGNLLPDRQSWLVTRYFFAGGACAIAQTQIDDCHVTDPAMFAGPGEVENTNA